MNNKVFISYAWGGESEEIVNKIDAVLSGKGLQVIRDKRELGFKGLIKEFMITIGQGNSIVAVISDKYLKSENCMFELLEVFKHKNFYHRIFPIVLNDADIYKPLGRIKYIKYWEDKIQELDNAMKTVGSANLKGIREDIDLFTEIRQIFSSITDKLRNVNALSVEHHVNNNFKDLYDALTKHLIQEEMKPQILKIEEWDKPSNIISRFIQKIFEDKST